MAVVFAFSRVMQFFSGQHRKNKLKFFSKSLKPALMLAVVGFFFFFSIYNCVGEVDIGLGVK